MGEGTTLPTPLESPAAPRHSRLRRSTLAPRLALHANAIPGSAYVFS